MHRFTPRLMPAVLVTGLVLAACGTEPTPSPTSTLEPTEASTPTPEPTEVATPAPEPTPTSTARPSPSPGPTTGGEPGGFLVLPHPAADALFLDRDTCANPRDGYELDFPEEWWTNTEIGRNPPCIWFSPTFYTVPDPSEVPDEIAITFEHVAGGTESSEELLSTESVTVGGQRATRAEWAGAQGEGGLMPPDWRRYEYVVQLGPTLEEGPNLVVQTTNKMGGDYALNTAVMDRMMATIQFLGSTQ